ncbi:hypothetical protein [Nesterenkonia sp. K-15-9-6]|uniref:hypothetical protein n=1 Tax=Nesterenkonia sp. K-15-9-6 TaxID=3093918 RepID=UPI004043A680
MWQVDPQDGMCSAEGCTGELRLRGIDLREGARMWSECKVCGALVYRPSQWD